MISKNQIESLISLIKELGQETEKIKKRDFDYELKSDGSPLTEADRFVNSQLLNFISTTECKNLISEEEKQTPYQYRRNWEFYWVIDPIDGTKEFIKKGNDYTINIALCKGQRPIFGIVSRPALTDIFYAAEGSGAKKNSKTISARNFTKGDAIKLVASKSHLNKTTIDYIENLKLDHKVETINIGSSLKICSVAEGEADLYPRFGPTCEWDTCAADIILMEAGGKILDSAGNYLKYNKKDFLNPEFIAYSCEELI